MSQAQSSVLELDPWSVQTSPRVHSVSSQQMPQRARSKQYRVPDCVQTQTPLPEQVGVAGSAGSKAEQSRLSQHCRQTVLPAQTTGFSAGQAQVPARQMRPPPHAAPAFAFWMTQRPLEQTAFLQRLRGCGQGLVALQEHFSLPRHLPVQHCAEVAQRAPA